MISVAFIGCGNIAKPYAESLRTRADLLRIAGGYDLKPENVEAALAGGGEKVMTYGSVEEVLADPKVDLVVNLTNQQAHYGVTTQALRAGKHVHSEKPLAVTRKEANALVALAKRKRLRLGCSPFTFLGEAQQTAGKLLREGALGKVRIVYAEMNWNRIEHWHPNPFFFYQPGAGPLFDVGVYPLTILTAFLGPVKCVSGFGRIVMPNRRTKTGKRFRVQTPDWVAGLLEFASGAVCRITASFYVGPTTQQGIEFHGDDASLYLSSATKFDQVPQMRGAQEKEWRDVQHVKAPYPGVEWGRAIFDLAEALRDGRPHRATGAQAAHVVDVCCGVLESAKKGGKAVAVRSRFKVPAPMPWAE